MIWCDMPIPEIKLSAEDKEKLLVMQPDIVALQREIAKAKSAGIDVAELEADLKQSLKLREGILRVYG